MERTHHHLSVQFLSFITARKRSLGQGNIFIGVCQEFCSEGGVSCPGGCLIPGGCLVQGGLLQGMPGPGGCLLWGVCLLPGGAWWRPPPDGYCCRWYASYWNSVHRGGVLSRRVPAPGGVPGPGGVWSRECLLQGGAWSWGCLLWGGVPAPGGAWWRPPRRLLLQAVRILLECILVTR